MTPRLRSEPRLLISAAFLLAILGPDVFTNFIKATEMVQGHESHWGAMAAFSVSITLLGFIAALRPPGWRLAAWSVTGAVVTLAVVSMAFRYDASALGVSHSIVALLWACGFGTTVAVVGAHDAQWIPVRRPADGLVAGVAAGVARQTGWKVGWVRAAFAVPILGGATYGTLWIALPVEGAAKRRTRAGLLFVWLLAVGIFSVVSGGPGGGFLLLVGGIAATVTLGIKPLVALSRRRVGIGAAAARIAAGVGMGAALLAVTGLWLLDDVSPPDVPHLIQGESFQYCVSCHAAEGVARGAPVLEDVIEHSEGNLCVSCHSHLPVSTPEASEASWRLPLAAGTP